jgi:hypothetical protein
MTPNPIAPCCSSSIGCLGGFVSLVRPSDGSGETTEPPPADPLVVPAPVAGVAELTVEEWLTATADDGDDLASLFVEPPAASGLPGASTDDVGGLDVQRVTTIGGQRLDDGYWSVTVVAELAGGTSEAEAGEGVADANDPGGPGVGGAEGSDDGTEADTGSDPAVAGGAEAVGADDAAEDAGRWYVQIGIVDDGGGGFVALAAPAVIPPPEPGAPARQVGGERNGPAEGDALAGTVERLLGAMLPGTGDPTPYFTPGAEVPPVEPAPFTELTVAELTTEPLEDGVTWVLAHVVATTPEGVQVPLTYDLVAVQRGDRWEVSELSGFPTFVE